MEGLLLAAQLARLIPHLPAERRAWRFADPTTAVLPLQGGPALWLINRPPTPRLELRDEVPEGIQRFGPFQEQLLARAVGPLVRAEQSKLDRTVRFDFGTEEGFVSEGAVSLVFELTGRNCNLILVRDGIVLGAAREVGVEVNRFRQVRSGLAYTPPPPYEKLDPRGADEGALRAALSGLRLERVRSAIDGVGPTLTRALIRRSGLAPDTLLEGASLAAAAATLSDLAADPERVVAEALDLPEPEAQRERERLAARRRRLQNALERELRLLNKRVRDAERTVASAERAGVLRGQADLLMSYPQQVPGKATRVTLEGFDGAPVEIDLDPAMDAIENAQRLYRQAKRRERRALDAGERRADLAAKRHEVEGALAAIDELDDDGLEARLERYAPEPVREAKPRGPGLRFNGPHGFEVVVGRSARENDEVTFKLGRSLDLWFHAQGYPGSHVLVRSGGREVPFDTVLFAARLAAGHSKAAQGDNVPVDYTLRKHVWKNRGMPPGAVYLTQQKTVYVTPSRSGESAAAGERG
jgi:predicted ribosome quality control (RQC) complex YloA/Tae2 family protein